MKRWFRPLSCLFLMFSASAGALNVSLPGWTPVAGDVTQWQDASGNCLLQEDRYGQAFPVLTTQAQATAMARQMQLGLLGRGMTAVTAQAIASADRKRWSVLASYDYPSGGSLYRVTQLYSSQSGILSTLSGSTSLASVAAGSGAAPAGSGVAACAAGMGQFIRSQAAHR